MCGWQRVTPWPMILQDMHAYMSYTYRIHMSVYICVYIVYTYVYVCIHIEIPCAGGNASRRVEPNPAEGVRGCM